MRQRDYQGRLRLLRLKSLHQRRLIIDLGLTFKVYRGEHFCPGVLRLKPTTRHLSHNHRLMHDPELKGKQRLIWPERIVQPWNSLPDHVIEGSYDAFMSFVDPWLSTCINRQAILSQCRQYIRCMISWSLLPAMLTVLCCNTTTTHG